MTWFVHTEALIHCRLEWCCFALQFGGVHLPLKIIKDRALFLDRIRRRIRQVGHDLAPEALHRLVEALREGFQQGPADETLVDAVRGELDADLRGIFADDVRDGLQVVERESFPELLGMTFENERVNVFGRIAAYVEEAPSWARTISCFQASSARALRISSSICSG
jgi:hypothetical protein